MELKEFIKSALKDIVDAVEEIRKDSSRDMYLTTGKEQRTVEFDIAVTIEDSSSGTGKAGIKVFQLVEGGGEVSSAQKNSSISRIQFGVYIDSLTKEETIRRERQSQVLSENSDYR